MLNKNNNIIINNNISDIKNIFLNLNNQNKEKIIAFLGPLYSYSHLAVLTYINNFFFKKKIINVSCHNFNEIFLHIKTGIIQIAIVPIINNHTGIIKEVLKYLKKNSTYVKIKTTIKLPIKNCLVTKKKNIFLNKIKKIYSHKEPLKQCSSFIKEHPLWEIKYCSSTSFAMNFIKNSSSQDNLAAIGNEIAARFYNLYIIKKNISNKKNNETTFLVLKKN
ncbi:hypothetical protein GJT93_02245 (plasmid) [Enterobacteriaceae endosymbiont of Donacia provostii]|uniref:prephenate dehydratase domain-containing protein n=1 Tax=Enterobacteriaceae endosymbiont of Donacia provostii TaxID=2675781 RepID=UPI00144947D2|nr:prephenate dehydratase domain-containing protein [Enterobacteriaceae endosymbiont of Donacia provostii]QJC33917.1 hypothetical protein GJT93_02245 [Enterobacteriaceae endosymbiont of Donacia provostii]